MMNLGLASLRLNGRRGGGGAGPEPLYAYLPGGSTTNNLRVTGFTSAAGSADIEMVLDQTRPVWTRGSTSTLYSTSSGRLVVFLVTTGALSVFVYDTAISNYRSVSCLPDAYTSFFGDDARCRIRIKYLAAGSLEFYATGEGAEELVDTRSLTAGILHPAMTTVGAHDTFAGAAGFDAALHEISLKVGAATYGTTIATDCEAAETSWTTSTGHTGALAVSGSPPQAAIMSGAFPWE